jgi:ribose transport system substrate-binding protein
MRDKNRYFIGAAAKTLDVLESFTDNAEQLSITEIAKRGGLSYTSAFRLLYTLEKRGYVMRLPGKKRYLLAPSRKRFRIGYAALGKIAFANEVTRSMHSAARRLGLALHYVDNEDSPAKAIANADELLTEGIDILIEFQRHDNVNHLIATKCHNAGVPVIAINFPLPGAYYFGADGYKTGWLAGVFLRQYVQKEWRDGPATCLILPTEGVEATQHTRTVGLLEGLTKQLPKGNSPEIKVAQFGVTAQDGYNLTKQFLHEGKRRPKYLLVAAFSDPLGIGAKRALKEAGIGESSVIASQGGTIDARRHIRRGGALKASVAYFPESYGERVLKLAIKILEGEHPPLTNHTDHVVLTADNISEFYDQKNEMKRAFAKT